MLTKWGTYALLSWHRPPHHRWLNKCSFLSLLLSYFFFLFGCKCIYKIVFWYHSIQSRIFCVNLFINLGFNLWPHFINKIIVKFLFLNFYTNHVKSFCQITRMGSTLFLSFLNDEKIKKKILFKFRWQINWT